MLTLPNLFSTRKEEIAAVEHRMTLVTIASGNISHGSPSSSCSGRPQFPSRCQDHALKIECAGDKPPGATTYTRRGRSFLCRKKKTDPAALRSSIRHRHPSRTTRPRSSSVPKDRRTVMTLAGFCPRGEAWIHSCGSTGEAVALPRRNAGCATANIAFNSTPTTKEATLQ